MVRPRVIVERILDKLKTGQPNSIEGKVIGSAGVADGARVHSDVAERLHPRGKDRGHHFVPLQIDAANHARSIIDAIVGVEPSMLLEGLHYFWIGKILLYIGSLSKEAPLLT